MRPTKDQQKSWQVFFAVFFASLLLSLQIRHTKKSYWQPANCRIFFIGFLLLYWQPARFHEWFVDISSIFCAHADESAAARSIWKYVQRIYRNCKKLSKPFLRLMCCFARKQMNLQQRDQIENEKGQVEEIKTALLQKIERYESMIVDLDSVNRSTSAAQNAKGHGRYTYIYIYIRIYIYIYIYRYIYTYIYICI